MAYLIAGIGIGLVLGHMLTLGFEERRKNKYR